MTQKGGEGVPGAGVFAAVMRMRKVLMGGELKGGGGASGECAVGVPGAFAGGQAGDAGEGLPAVLAEDFCHGVCFLRVWVAEFRRSFRPCIGIACLGDMFVRREAPLSRSGPSLSGIFGCRVASSRGDCASGAFFCGGSVWCPRRDSNPQDVAIERF